MDGILPGTSTEATARAWIADFAAAVQAADARRLDALFAAECHWRDILAFTWDLPGTPEPKSLVTFVLVPIDDGVELTLTHEHLPDDEARASHRAGWNGLLDKLLVFLGDAE